MSVGGAMEQCWQRYGLADSLNIDNYTFLLGAIDNVHLWDNK